MKDKFTITIHDLNGIRQYTLKQVVKKFFFYFIGFIVFIIVVGAAVIIFLTKQVNELEAKKDKILNEYKTLIAENQRLRENIAKKNQEFQEVATKLENIEEKIGLKPPEKLKLSERILKVSFTSSEIYYMFRNIPNGYPIRFKRISAKFGYRIHPITHRREFHKGIDLAADVGTPVYATADGIVEFAGRRTGYGKTIMIQHNYGFETLYAHLKKIKVRVGDFVKKGQLIGFSGNTGLSNGPHLHYEIRYLGRPLNPVNFMNWNRLKYKEIFHREEHIRWQSLVKAITKDFLILPQNQKLKQQ